jgi:hypothetical protein
MKATNLIALSLAALAFAGCAKEDATVEGKSHEKLTLEKPSDVTIERGGTAKVDLDISRKDLTGDVTVTFSKLPAGVDVVDASNRIVGDEGTYTLTASPTADLVEKSAAQVTATAAGGISVTQTFNVTVKDKK